MASRLHFVFFSFSTQVYFNITIGFHSCPDHGADEDIQVMVRPVGYNESTTVRIHSKCQCGCGSTRRCHESGRSPCAGTIDGPGWEPKPHRGLVNESNSNCRAEGARVDCSGRGVCECGRCTCEHSRLGTIFGKYCESDDFSCSYKDGLLCAGKFLTGIP